MVRTDVPELDREFGMLCWLTDANGFKGVLKERYEDFIVEEIVKEGYILSLENPRLLFSGYEGLFTHFILIKKGKGNFEAIWELSKILRVPVGFFFYSGNKDRDAITVQRVAVWNVPPEKLLNVKLPDGLKICSPIRELRRVFVGEHKGNHFKIRIRDVDNLDYAEKISQEILSNYLPNFFGYQRFGIMRPISHIVGKLLLLRKYKEAVITFLAAPSLTDNEFIAEVKDRILQEDFESAYKMIPKRTFVFEAEMLRVLRRNKDYKKALKRLPSFMLRMLIEAYQALIFNKLLSLLLIDEYPLISSDGKITKLPILGTNIRIKDQKVRNTLMLILSEENISLSMLSNKEFPPLTFKGTMRKSLVKPILDKLIKENDSLIISFSLEKGSYATTILRELLKENIIDALMSKLRRERPYLFQKNLKRLNEFKKNILKEFLDGG